MHLFASTALILVTLRSRYFGFSESCRSKSHLIALCFPPFKCNDLQDEKLIQEGNLGSKLEIAVRVRVGEKRVLQQIEGIFKEKEARLDKFEYYHERRSKELGLVGEEGETYCQPKMDSTPSL